MMADVLGKVVNAGIPVFVAASCLLLAADAWHLRASRARPRVGKGRPGRGAGRQAARFERFLTLEAVGKLNAIEGRRECSRGLGGVAGLEYGEV